MAEFTYLERQRLEKLLGMGSGYVLRFSDKTFREFIHDTTGRNIDDEKYKTAGTSKANRLRTFWSKESDAVVGKLLNEMLQLAGDETPQLRESEAYQQSMAVAHRLLGQRATVHVVERNKRVTKTSHPSGRNVFVVYGRDTQAKREMFRFLRAIGLKPIDFSEAIDATGKASPYIGEVLEVAFAQAQAVLVVMTPDDEVRLREPFQTSDDEPFESQLTGQPRPNVIFEAGMALGLFPERTLLVELGKIRPISDLSGRHVIKLRNSPQARQQLARRLEKAGCDVDLDGDTWLEEGNFEIRVVTTADPKSNNGVLKRIQEALDPPHHKWRTVERVAFAAGMSVEDVRGILQAYDQVRFTKGSKGELLVGLRSRVDKK
jgi:predicted nucleotide-binding protein